MPISLGSGGRNTPYPKTTMEEMLEQKLESVGFPTPHELSARLGKKVKGNAFRGKAGVTVPPTGLHRNMITLLVQANDNSTCFECHVTIPGTKEEVSDLFEKLRKSIPATKPRATAKPRASAEPTVLLQEHPQSPEQSVAKHSVPQPAEPPRSKLEVAELLRDQATRQIILDSLSERMRKSGSLSGVECINVLMAAIGGLCERRQFVPLLKQLLARGFLKADTTFSGKPQKYLLVSQGKVPLTTSTAKPKKAARLPAPPGKIKEGAGLLGDFLAVKERLLSLRIEEQALWEKLATLISAKDRLLKEKEDLAEKITQALK